MQHLTTREHTLLHAKLRTAPWAPSPVLCTGEEALPAVAAQSLPERGLGPRLQTPGTLPQRRLLSVTIPK